ncbi:MAG: hypothetical protein ACLSB9_22860 [Hydrogeniiclostridium mannosilyticum]
MLVLLYAMQAENASDFKKFFIVSLPLRPFRGNCIAVFAGSGSTTQKQPGFEESSHPGCFFHMYRSIWSSARFSHIRIFRMRCTSHSLRSPCSAAAHTRARRRPPDTEAPAKSGNPTIA